MDLNIERKNSYITSTEYFDGGARMSWNLYYLIKSRNEVKHHILTGQKPYDDWNYMEIYNFFGVASVLGLEELYQREMIKNN